MDGLSSHNCIIARIVNRSLCVARHFTAWLWKGRSQNSSLQHFLFWDMFSFIIQRWKLRKPHEILLTFQRFLAPRRDCHGTSFFGRNRQSWSVLVLSETSPAGGRSRIDHTFMNRQPFRANPSVFSRIGKSQNVIVHKFA